MMLPQMQQAIQLLQTPVMELSQMIDMEMERNPLLDLHEESFEEVERTQEDEEREEQGVTIDDNDFEILKKLDEEYRDFFNQNLSQTEKRTSDEKKLRAFLDQNIRAEETLFSHLMGQAHESFETEEELRLAEMVIGSLDDSGFIGTDLEEIVLIAETDVESLKKVIAVIQEFDPVGVCAADIRESLLIQLEAQGKKDSLAYKIIETCYEELIHNHIPAVQKKLNEPVEAIQKAVHEEISRLDLHPGAWFSNPNKSYIVPDAQIELENEELIISINDESVPSLRLNPTYLKMLRKGSVNDETKEYIQQHVLSAKWLMKNLMQRNDTIRRILEYIVSKQREFLSDPEGELLPMTMLELAESLDLHESTIARAVSYKYVYTPRGLLGLRSFFTTGYVTVEGEEISNEKVKHELEKIIEEEDKSKPLSDEKISELLKKKGISCARRTISKYRRALNIGNAQQRKVYS